MTDIVAAIAQMQENQANIPPDSPKAAPPDPDFDPPAAYRGLLAATEGVIREIVELHGPKPWNIRPDGTVPWWQCQGCEATGYEWDYPDWPCGTTDLIAGHLGVSLREAHYTVDVP